MSALRLGFHYHTPATEVDSKIKMPAYLGLFVDSLANQCNEVVCFLHAPNEYERPQMDYALKAENVRLVSLRQRNSIPVRTLKAFSQQDLFRRWQSELDVMLIRGSTPLLPVIAAVWHKPIVLLLVSDATVGLENLPQPGWRKAMIAVWARWYQSRQNDVARKSLTFVNSRLLYDQHADWLPNLLETRTTTLREGDFFERSDTCGAFPYRMLFAGRVTPSKGLFEIVEALGHLVNEGHDVVFDLVGMVETGTTVLNKLYTLAEDRGVRERVHYHGYRTAGDQLLAFYRRADVFVTASQASSEGFPRTIWEAMASSLPVVATEVGSIPAFAGDAVLLVPPKDVGSLTDALRRIITEPDLRRNLIRRGLRLARENTLEKRAAEMTVKIEEWLGRTSGSVDSVESTTHHQTR